MARKKTQRPETGVSLKTLGIWHQRLGLISAMVIVWMAVSGIALNHSDSMDLDNRFVSSRVLLAWYGMVVPEPRSFAAADDWIIQLGDRLYFNRLEISGQHPELIGAAAINGMRVAATSTSLVLLSSQGELLEVLGAEHGLPVPIEAVVAGDGGLILRTTEGKFRADAELTEWKPTTSEPTTWSQAEPAPPAIRDAVMRLYRGKGLSWERLLRDLHSGSLFGTTGRLVIDAFALMFVVLAITGIWIWWRRKNEYSSKKKKGRA